MRVGLCFDLRSWYQSRGFSPEETAEFDKEETISAIDEALNSLGFLTDHIGNIFQLVEALASGRRWDLIFNISEGVYGPARESVVPALLDQYRIPYVFSNAEVLGISLNKQLARQVVAAHGVPVPPGCVIHNPDDLRNVDFDFPVFVKPLYEGTGKGISEKSRVTRYDALTEAVERVIRDNHQPALVEEYLPGREFTVGIVGSGVTAEVVGAMEIFTREGSVYSLNVKENYEQLAHYKPVDTEMMEECTALTLKSWVALGGADGGRIDFRCDKHGRLCFLEANPLAGLNPVHSDLPMLARMNNIPYSLLIEKIMESALKRLNIRR